MPFLYEKDFVARDWGDAGDVQECGAVDHVGVLCDSIREFMILSFG